LDAGVSMWRLGFNSRLLHVRLVGDKVTMKQVSIGANFGIVIPFYLLTDIYILLSERYNTVNTMH
jgi:uncharacterized membrane protein (DUF485 family)